MSITASAADDPDSAVALAATALRDGELVVVPTDTVYGLAADAFNPEATRAVFVAKRRPRTTPLPVLVRGPKQVMGLVTRVPETAERLMAAWWPGPLTIVVRAEPNLAWDLGDNDGTVAVRMPFDDVTLRIIREVGPLAVTSANLSGSPAATAAALARTQLGDAVSVYVDGGTRADTTPSTIVDLTRATPTILRAGPLDGDEVVAVATGALEPHLATPWQPPGAGPVDPAGAAAAPTDPGPSDPGPTEDADEALDARADTPEERDAEADERRRRRRSRHVAIDHRAQ